MTIDGEPHYTFGAGAGPLSGELGEMMTDGTGDSPDEIASKRAETLAAILATSLEIQAVLKTILARPELPETGP